MKTLYLECGMGAAGDMLLAALYELDPDRKAALAALNGLGIPHVRYFVDPSEKCGILGTHMTVTVYDEEEESWDSSCMEQVVHDEPTAQAVHFHGDSGGHHAADGHAHEQYGPDAHTRQHDHPHPHDGAHPHTHEQCGPDAHTRRHDHSHPHDGAHTHTHEHGHHHHTGMAEIESLIASLHCSDAVKEQILSVYTLIAEAESKAHGRPVSEIHFHEVGSLDAIADVAGVCLMLERLAPERITASPVTVGFGQVRCAHGILPVPAPATAFLLRGIPTQSGRIQGELCTPTGAALLRRFAEEFSGMPVMAVRSIGYGMGKKDFEAANCVRAMLGEADGGREELCELRCNLDDMTGEAIAYAQQLLLKEGALDVFLTPVQMKKSRPAVLLTCLCRREDSEKFSLLMLRHTTTLGVREISCRRISLARSSEQIETAFGKITVKTSEGFGVRRQKPEYDEVAAAAEAAGAPFEEVARAVDAALDRQTR